MDLMKWIDGTAVRRTWATVLLMSVAVFMAGLPRATVPTVDGVNRSDEARYIVKSGSWFPIVWKDKEIVTDHPPLYVWLSAASMKAFGVNDWAANLPQRAFAVGSVIATAGAALEAGFGPTAMILSALITCLTRDYVLSSVRGYIEPILSFFTMLALWFCVRALKRGSRRAAAGAGMAIFLAAFSKGPPAAWPLLACVLILAIPFGKTARSRVALVSAYGAGFVGCVLAFVVWTDVGGHWGWWRDYFYGQVMASAVDGRAGAQRLEPFYFVSILVQYYWPWLPLLLLAMWKNTREIFSPFRSEKNLWLLVFALYGWGFVGGFSLVKWKFWYYIAPAFPAFALAIGCMGAWKLAALFDGPAVTRFVRGASFAWIALVCIAPIPVHFERVPEVMSFRDTILKSPVQGPVWFVHGFADHNMIGTSGQWYFERDVLKVEDHEEAKWAAEKLTKPSWIITSLAHWKFCNAIPANAPERIHQVMRGWCRKSRLIQVADAPEGFPHGPSALVLFSPDFPPSK